MIAVELAPEVQASLRAMKDRGTPPRCSPGVIESAIRIGVRRFSDGTLSSVVRPWDLPELQRRAVELVVVDEYLGQGETETSVRYQWTEGSRSILAEEIKNEIYDGATPYTTYVRGVIVDGDRGVLLTGRDDSALIIEG